MHILVVDDASAIRDGVCEALRRQGHQTAACDGAAVAATMVPYVDAVICDGLDFAGFAVVARASRLDKPVVLYTGSDAIATAAVAGRIPCVRKPASVDALLAALRLPQAVAA